MTNVLLEKKGNIAVATINRPKALNALNSDVLTDLGELVDIVNADSEIRALIITGSGEKAFVAGADIGEMSTLTPEEGEAFGKHGNDVFRRIETLPIPTIAAINGFALGGGCELAMMCDFIIAGEKAKFGQPEVNLGITPGMGGSQRLTRAVGKAKAMEMCLTGRMMDAEEAERSGLVAQIVAPEELLNKALETANLIASKSQVTTSMIKEQVNVVYETSLSQGLLFERRTFHSLFASQDQKEGMAAFSEKREPNFKNS